MSLTWQRVRSRDPLASGGARGGPSRTQIEGARQCNYTPPPHVTQHWQLSKPSAKGRRGMVVSQAKGAAEAGVAVLDAGGNAIDAAVATALALATHEPWNSGLGGIGFALVHRAGQKRAEVVDFGPRAPAATDPARYKLTGRMTTDLFAWPEVEGDINIHGPLSVAIPASVAGYDYMHRQWGQLPLSEVIAPAIALAKRGLPQDWYTTLKVATSASAIKLYPTTAAVYLPNGLPPAPPYQGKPGFFRQGNLPDTLERLGKAGLRDFYEGEVAASVAADIQRARRRAVARRSARLPGAHLAGRGSRLARPHVATHRRPDRGADAEARAGGHGRRALRRRANRRAAWYRALARVMKAAYAERLAGLGEIRAAGSGKLHDAPDRLRRRGQHGGDDHDADVVVRQPRAAAAVGRAAEQRHDVVRSATGRAELDRAGQAPAVQHAADHPAENGRPFVAAGASGGRRIMAAVFQLMTFIADFGMDVDDRGASSAHRCLQRRQGYRRRAAAGRGAALRWRRTARWRWWSTTRCPSTSPARTSSCSQPTARAPASAMRRRPGRRDGAGLIILSPILH